MKQPIYCAYKYCQAELMTPLENRLGYCNDHLAMMSDRKCYVGLCWKCNTITRIEEIPHRLERVWQDKYLFTEACSLCTHNADNDIKWVTFNKFEPNHRMAIGDNGKLIDDIPQEEPNVTDKTP